MDERGGSTPAGTVFDTYGDISQPTVVLIHGLGLSRSVTWAGMVPRLARDYHIVAYDLAGHGESAAPSAEPTLTLFAEQIIELLDTLSIERAALMGFSLGGMINRRFAIDHPQRVTSLVILNSPHERGAEQQQRVEEQARATDAGGIQASLSTVLARWFTPQYLAQDPGLVQEIRKGLLGNDPTSYAACRWTLAAGVTELIRPTPAVNTPSLVMTCERDSGSTPAMSHAIASEISGSETVIVPGLQHMGLVEQPQAFLPPILDFLSRHAHR